MALVGLSMTLLDVSSLMVVRELGSSGPEILETLSMLSFLSIGLFSMWMWSLDCANHINAI